MLARILVVGVALAAGALACTDRPEPTAPPTHAVRVPGAADPDRVRMQRLARQFALALADSSFRAHTYEGLAQSPFPERKLHFQGLLTRDNQRVLRDLARASGTSETLLQEDAANAMALEIYLPVPHHRTSWTGDDRVLVATAITDEEAPVAFDTRGAMHLLDPNTPPSIPVLGLVPLETDFSRKPPARADCTLESCSVGGGGTGGGTGGGSGGGGGPGGGASAPGLYMTYAHATQSFESWLKGNPEFEVHVLGQLGQTDSLTDYQCSGEHAGGPYTYDQNGLDWNGNVLLFSQTQLDSYRAQHPNQSIRIFLVEDDDTACVIRNGSNKLEAILAVVDGAYSLFTGGKDSTTGTGKLFQKARALQKLLQKLAQLIKTDDELVGNAVADAVVGQYHSGANWIIKGENNITNGWIKLVMQ